MRRVLIIFGIHTVALVSVQSILLKRTTVLVLPNGHGLPLRI